MNIGMGMVGNPLVASGQFGDASGHSGITFRGPDGLALPRSFISKGD